MQGELGHGGMGVVYLGEQLGLGRPVAVKVLHPTLAHERAVVQRFVHEARALSQLRHPGIVTLYDAGFEDDQAYLAMEYVPGAPLDQLLRQRRLGPTEVERVGLQLADALAYLYAQGVVYRDVKPSNVVVQADGRAVLTDFGIARSLVATQVTQTGQTLGTPTYMSPEQARGLPVDPRSDVYSLGVVLYEMLSGRPPFLGDTLAVLHQHAYERPPSLSALGVRVPRTLVRAVEHCLAKDPVRQRRTAADLAVALRGQSPGGPRPAGRGAGVADHVQAQHRAHEHANRQPCHRRRSRQCASPYVTVARRHSNPVTTATPTITPSTSTPTIAQQWAATSAELDHAWERDWPSAIRLLDDFLSQAPDYGPAREKLYSALFGRATELIRAGQPQAGDPFLQRAQIVFPGRSEASAMLLSLTPTPVPVLTTPVPPPRSYVTYNSNNGAIFALQGGTTTTIVDNGTNLAAPSWSRDGRSLAYVCNNGKDDLCIWREGNAPQSLTASRPGGVSYPRWSPNGREIIYLYHCTSGAPDTLMAIRPDGTGERVLVPPPADMASVNWAGAVVFARWQGGKGTIVAVDSRGRESLLTTRGSNDAPAWSPDGRTIAFESDRNGGDYQIFLMAEHQHWAGLHPCLVV